MNKNNISGAVYSSFCALFFLFAFIQEKTFLYLLYLLFLVISILVAADSFQKAFNQLLEKLEKNK